MAPRIKEVLNEEILKITPSGEEVKSINFKVREILSALSGNMKKSKIKADVFIGGSFAKDTLIRKGKHDVDIFVRFDSEKYGEEEKLAELLKKIVPKNSVRVHGSRDYFRIKQDNIEFEIIPVLKIKKPSEAKNITDLSYFHVNYIKNKIKKNKKLADEIRLAKAFLYYQNCYGAESYINGFSGYAVELLMVSYGGFVRFLDSCLKHDFSKGKIIIDAEKLYKNKETIMREMNEAKLNSPIVLVDPTFKERNALAALSNETFDKFKQVAAKFAKNPSEKFFEFEDREKILDKKYGNKIVRLELHTDRQAGDIAGTKMKKFSGFFIDECSRYFDILDSEFAYEDKTNTGKIILAIEQKKEIIFPGPPVTMKKPLAAFRKEHRNIKIKNGKAYAVEKSSGFEKFMKDFENVRGKIIEEMGIIEIKRV